MKEYLDTKLELREHLKNFGYDDSAENIMSRKGGMALIHTKARPIFVVFRVYFVNKMVTIDYYFSATCPKKHKKLVLSYLKRVNDQLLNGKFLISTNNAIYLNYEIDIKNKAVKEVLFNKITQSAIETIEEQADAILNITNGNILANSDKSKKPKKKGRKSKDKKVEPIQNRPKKFDFMQESQVDDDNKDEYSDKEERGKAIKQAWRTLIDKNSEEEIKKDALANYSWQSNEETYQEVVDESVDEESNDDDTEQYEWGEIFDKKEEINRLNEKIESLKEARNEAHKAAINMDEEEKKKQEYVAEHGNEYNESYSCEDEVEKMDLNEIQLEDLLDSDDETTDFMLLDEENFIEDIGEKEKSIKDLFPEELE